MRERLRRWLRPKRLRPQTLDEAIDTIEGNRDVIRWLGIATSLLVLGLPFVTWIAVSVGERGRASNCEVVEETFHGFSDGIVDNLLTVADPPTTPEQEARLARIEVGLRDGLHAKVASLMEGCG